MLFGSFSFLRLWSSWPVTASSFSNRRNSGQQTPFFYFWRKPVSKQRINFDQLRAKEKVQQVFIPNYLYSYLQIVFKVVK